MSTVISSTSAVDAKLSRSQLASPAAAILQQAVLFDPMEAFMSRCGKRIRHAMVQLSYQLAGGDGVIPACLAGSIEMLHAGSLVIDDIQDDSQSRRGVPTLHRELGVPLAINAGNWMYFEALDQLTSSELAPNVQLQCVAKMIAAGKRCHEGQAIDLAARVDQLPPADFHQVAFSISQQKTGCLVSLATEFGAIAAGADRRLAEALSGFGMEIGLTLQMRNDLDELLSLVRDPYDSLRSDDLRHARVTWPWAWVAKFGQPQQVQTLIDQTSSAGDDPVKLVAVANQLLNLVYNRGDRLIRNRIGRELARLRRFTADSNAVDELTIALKTISHPKTKPHATEQRDVQRN